MKHCSIRRVRSLLLLVSMLVLVGACTSTPNFVQVPPEPPLRSDLPSIIDKQNPSQLFTLSAYQLTEFNDYFYADEHRAQPPHLRLANFLEQNMTQFTFKGDTHNAATALTRMEGNCLSLAVLTTALARSVGLEVQYRRVNTSPIYHRFNGLLALSSHVQTKVFAPTEKVDEDGRTVVRYDAIVIDYFPQQGNISGDAVSEQDFIAMYYQNKAADKLFESELDAAEQYLLEGLAIAPHNASLINSMAVVYKRQGFGSDAAALYDYGVNYTNTSLLLLDNYASLLEQNGDQKRADALRTRLVNINDDNPYHWIDLASVQAVNQNWHQAQVLYQKAVEQGPYLHEAHFGLAKVYLARGFEASALKHMQRAKSLARYDMQSALYAKKVEVLSKAQIRP